ncbi:MAG: type II CAAX endopeptidase family protein [Chloroflexota bacterium]
MKSTTTRKIIVFLFLTFALSAFFYAKIVSTSSISNYTFGLMWCPGIAGILTQLIFERKLGGLGWKLKPFRYLLLAYFLPLIYGLVVYGLVWLSGAAPLNIEQLAMQVSQQTGENISPLNSVVSYVFNMATLGMIFSIITALGEEIGWRGLFVPELARAGSFTSASVISGIIWAVWHFPLILFADYHTPGAPVWFGLVCFTLMVLGISFTMAWMRLKSGSLWPAVFLHASHNIFIQGVFTPLTGQSSLSPFLIDEFGLGLALIGILLIWTFWRKRAEVATV